MPVRTSSLPVEALDLASVDSIEAFGERLRHSQGIDLLINNAAVDDATTLDRSQPTGVVLDQGERDSQAEAHGTDPLGHGIFCSGSRCFI